MKKKILSGILALAVMISCSNGISVSAETLQSTPENIISENDGQMEFLQISDEEVPATEIPETELNVEERNYTGTELSLSSIMPYSENDDVSNADPNYAYLVENNNAYQGSIENEKEFETRHIMCASGMDAEERRIESASHNSEHNVQI